MANFDPWIQLRLLELQKLDSRIDSLNSRKQKLPEAAELASVEELLRGMRVHEIAGITEVADRELDVAKAEEDVATVRLRSSKDQELLDSGRITDPKQLTELQHEVGSLARRQSELEDTEMEIMQLLEDAQKSLASIQEKMAGVSANKERLSAEVTAINSKIDSELVTLSSEREILAAELPVDLLKIYDRAREVNAGVGAAMLSHARCNACGIQFNASALSNAKSASPETLLRCDECQAILVRTAESGI